MTGARRAALTALERCRRSGAWSDAVLGGVMDAAGLDGRERALCAQLCAGVMQRMYLLDYYIGCYCSTKPEKLEPKVRDILRVSAYQIIFLDRIPNSAAVNEGVKLCRGLGYARASGLVNAVLRRLSENAQKLPPVCAESWEQELSIKYSCPVKLTSCVMDMFGPEQGEALLRAQNEPIPLTVQCNTLRTDTLSLLESLRSHGVEAAGHPFLPDCLLVDRAGAVAQLEEFRAGLFYVQDVAAKLSVMAAGPKRGDRVLDVCAAPGGKSFAAWVLSGGGVRITACDLHENKLKRIREGAGRLGIKDMETVSADGRAFRPEWDGVFDVVLADVPCSGLGVIRKKPDIRYKDMADFAALPEIQREIVTNASRYVKPGGVLLYSTCTFRREENGAVADSFLESRGNFRAEDFNLPGGLSSQNGRLQLMPHIHGTDGFFIAKFRRDI